MKTKQNIVIFFLLVIPCAASTNLVSLKLTTTGCEQNCIKGYYADNSTKCPSSILIDGKEKSRKGDGFNIAVIDNDSGHVMTTHFRWSASKLTEKRRDFRNFFSKIKSRSIVVIVFQNMCSYFDKDWYRFMYDYNIKLSKPSQPYSIATVVACKLSCPQVAKGSPSLPFSYATTSQKRRTDITFKLGTSAWNFRGDRSSHNEKGRAVSIVMIAAPVGGVVGCAIAFLICVYLYKRASQHNQNRYNRNMYLQRNTPENGTCGGTACIEPLYEELDNITQVDEKSNIYVDRNDMKHAMSNGGPEQNVEATPLTNVPSAPPLYLYHNDA